MRESKNVLLIIVGLLLVVTGWFLPNSESGSSLIPGMFILAGTGLVIYALYRSAR
jgi:hypothetical protein